jgi:hypothetical protein
MASKGQDAVEPPRLVAVAVDRYLKPSTAFQDLVNLAGLPPPKFGQDITFGISRKAPGGQSVGTGPKELTPRMRKLLSIFAGGDTSGMSTRLFDKFLAPSRAVSFFEDADLNGAADKHEHINVFCNAALSAPDLPNKSEGRTRIHQALKTAGWNLKKLVIPTDLGVPAFNIGSKAFKSGDFNNGLGVMINGVQWVYVLATHYHHDSAKKTYSISLKYVFYDVFGLDDDDLDEFGASSDSRFSSNAAIGITAWWQLQHQYGYAPLITRVVLERTFEASAT